MLLVHIKYLLLAFAVSLSIIHVYVRIYLRKKNTDDRDDTNTEDNPERSVDTED